MQSADWVSAEFACASYRQLKLASLGQVLDTNNFFISPPLVDTHGLTPGVYGIIFDKIPFKLLHLKRNDLNNYL